MTDDVVHAFINRAGDSIYFVDLGNPIPTNGLQALIDDVSCIKNVYIFITHYHIDHVSSLAGLIANTDITLTLVVPRALMLPFAGWYLENYPHVLNKIKCNRLKVRVIEDEWM